VSPVPPDSQDPRESGYDGEAERDRLLSAFTRSVAERGYRELTLEAVARTAGVSQAQLEAHFATKEGALIAAQEVFLDRLWSEVITACRAPGDWAAKVAAGLGSAITALAEGSALARVFTVEAVGASLVATERHFAAIDRYASLLAEGRSHYPRAGSLPEPAERTLIGGIASIAAASLLAEEPGALLTLRPQLTEMLLIPYVGQEQARRAARPE
jgi:AcrR family transcriptional regulator